MLIIIVLEQITCMCCTHSNWWLDSRNLGVGRCPTWNPTWTRTHSKMWVLGWGCHSKGLPSEFLQADPEYFTKMGRVCRAEDVLEESIIRSSRCALLMTSPTCPTNSRIRLKTTACSEWYLWISWLFWLNSWVMASTCASSWAFSVSSFSISFYSAIFASSWRMFPGP